MVYVLVRFIFKINRVTKPTYAIKFYNYNTNASVWLTKWFRSQLKQCLRLNQSLNPLKLASYRAIVGFIFGLVVGF